MAKKTKLVNELREKLLANSKVDETAMLSDSIVFEPKDMIPTLVPMVNIALSGRLDGGLLPGATMIAGVSKNFKTGFGLLLVSSFLNKYKDGVVLFYDSEFGSPSAYFKTFGINPDNVIHTPVTTVEELIHDIVNQLNGIKRGDHVMILIDSIGNLASMKEMDDAEKGSDKADMTRAKKLKALFRMIVPKLNLKMVPLVAINHTYQTMEMYSKAVVGGGTGGIYGANDIWIVGRQQDKETDKKVKTLVGFDFVINIEKSRTIKEKSKIPINVSFENGIQKWSGMLDLAIEGGIIDQQASKYIYPNTEEGNTYSIKEIEYNTEFWTRVLAESNLASYIETKYRLPENIMLEEKEEVIEEV